MRRLIILPLIITIALATAASGQQAAKTQVTRKLLDNGLTVLVKPEPGTGLVAIVAIVKAGAAQESIQNAGIGNFIANLLLASTKQNSAEMVASIADEVGGNIGAEWHPDFAHIRAVTTSAKFGDAMSLIGECLMEANFEQEWVEQVRADLLERLKYSSEDLADQAYSGLRELLYEDSGYRRPLLGLERTIRLATPQDLKNFHSAYYVPNNMIISIAGDVTADDALRRVEMAFAGTRPGKLPVDRGMPDETMTRSRFKAAEVDLPMAYLMVGWLAPGVSSPDYPAMAVAVNALGGGKSSLMFTEMRQKQGMGYDMGTRYPRFRYQSHAIAYVFTDPYKLSFPSMTPTMVLEDVKTALMEQVEALKNKPLSQADLERAKGYTIGTYALQHQRLLDRAFNLGWLETIGAGYDFDKQFESAVEKVTAEDVQKVAQKYFGNYAAVLLLPKTVSPPSGAGEN